MKRHDVDADRWIEFSVTLPSEFAEPVTHLFSRYGDGRVFVSQSGDWDADEVDSDYAPEGKVTVFGYLKSDDSVENRKGMIDVGLRLMAELTDIEPYQVRSVSSEEWANQTFPKIRVGKRIMISPWMLERGLPERADGDDIEVFLSPGLAFGTGNHPTTRLCLKEIESVGERGLLSGRSVLDIGCGSGVLAIVALKMGAASATCLDIDETAVRAVRDNLVMSDVAERARVMHGSLPNNELPQSGFDYVFANITSKVLIDMARPLTDATKPNGVVLASGILEEHRHDVQDAFLRTGSASLDGIESEGDWLMMRFSKIAAW